MATDFKAFKTKGFNLKQIKDGFHLTINFSFLASQSAKEATVEYLLTKAQLKKLKLTINSITLDE
jgi:hypothetical protein